MKKAFRSLRLGKANAGQLKIINAIIDEFKEGGYVMTLRQLYYQLVSRDIIPNKQTEYDRLGKLLKEGRMAGLVDWGAIEDRLRVPRIPAAWDTPEDILRSAHSSYAVRRLEGQSNYLEVWVEKDALSGVLSPVTDRFHVPLMVNRGYSSVSAMYDAYNRFQEAIDKKQRITVLYLGDFDPSGEDMIRDVNDRIVEMLKNCNWVVKAYNQAVDEKDEPDSLLWQLACNSDYNDCISEGKWDALWAFVSYYYRVVPIALTTEQIRMYNPPTNPAKLTDSRAKGFIERHGRFSYEVDALRPDVLNDLLTEAIASRLDMDMYEASLAREEADKARLQELIDTF